MCNFKLKNSDLGKIVGTFNFIVVIKNRAVQFEDALHFLCPFLNLRYFKLKIFMVQI